MRRALLALILVAFVAGPFLLLVPARGGEGEASPSSPLPEAEVVIREALVVRKARSVVFAHVLEVHESPGVWCGFAVTRHEVTWQVDRLLDGKPVGERVRVGHLLVAGSRLVDREEPRLDPAKIHPGVHAVLCLEQDAESRWVVLDEAYGVRPTRVPDPDSGR